MHVLAQRGLLPGGDKKSYEASVTQEVKSVVPNLAPSSDSGKSRDKAAAVVNVSHGSLELLSMFWHNVKRPSRTNLEYPSSTGQSSH